MTFRCRYCHREFAWERHSYPYVRSLIVLHLAHCDHKSLSTYDRALEASREADELFGFKTIRRDEDSAPERPEDDARVSRE